jgi:hypothetical protein
VRSNGIRGRWADCRSTAVRRTAFSCQPGSPIAGCRLAAQHRSLLGQLGDSAEWIWFQQNAGLPNGLAEMAIFQSSARISIVFCGPRAIDMPPVDTNGSEDR